MKNTNNKIKLALLASAFGVSGTTYAATCPPIGVVQTLLNPALVVQLKSVGLAHDAYNATVSTQLLMAFGNIQNAIVEQNMLQAEAAMEAADMQVKNNTEIDRLSSETKMDYVAYLSAAQSREKNALTPTGKGGYAMNKQYFKQLCEMDKSASFALNKSSTISSLDRLRTTSGELAFSAKGALLVYEGGKVVDKHYSSYCSIEDQRVGLCSEEALIPNADLLSFVFFNPQNESGKNVIKDLKFKTEYTYSDYEKKAAKSYIEHMVSMVNLQRPPTGSETLTNNIAQSSRYRQLMSMIDLSRFAFSKVYEARMPITKVSDVNLGKIDMMRLMNHKALVSDMSSVTNATSKGKLMFIMRQMSFKDVIELEIAEARKLNNDLLAAILAEKNSKPSMIEEISKLK